MATARERGDWYRTFELVRRWVKTRPEEVIPVHLLPPKQWPVEKPREVRQADFESGLRAFVSFLGKMQPR